MTDGFPSADGAQSPRISPWLGLLLILSGLLTSGCNDNVSCILVNGCREDGGLGDLGAAATLPEDGQWIVNGPPVVERAFPDGGTVAGTSPMVVVFNESMNPETLDGAFSLVPIVNGFEMQPIPLPSFALLGDGRALVLFPAVNLVLAEYVLVVNDGADIRDITGQSAALNAGEQLANFAVGSQNPDDVAVVATYPVDVASGQSETGQIVVVFDRQIQLTTVTSDSIQVTIDGSDPVADPDPEVLFFEQFGTSISEPRVFTWRSVDAMGEQVALPLGGQVLLEVSPDGSEITDITGAAVLPFVSSYTLNDLARPSSAQLLSQPMDAIGTANLTAGNAEELLIQIDLAEGQAGDFLDLFVFGTSLDVNPQTIAMSRELTLEGASPIETAFYGLDDVDLLLSAIPLEARFADGPVSFAFRLRRGGLLTPLRVLDVNRGTDGIQDPVLDTTGPVIQELSFAGGGLDSVRSNLRDIVITGRADEFVRAIELMSIDFGDNGVLAAVTGLDEDGLFLSAPIEVGILPVGEHQLTAVAYDEAFNPSPPFSLTYRQVGVVGPEVFAPGDLIDVAVFDAITLQPIEGAMVFAHGDEGNGVDYPLADVKFTGLEGNAVLASLGGASIATNITVEALGYDIFSFQDITSRNLSLPLTPTGSEASATVAGNVTTSDIGVIFFVNLFTRLMGDSRRPEEARPFFEFEACALDPFGNGSFACPFGPEPIRPGLTGVQTLLLGNFAQDEGTLVISLLVQAFAIRFPLEVQAPGDASISSLDIPFLLDAGAPLEEQATELVSTSGLPLSLASNPLGSIDLNDLVGDAMTTGDPFVTVEALSPGVPGPFPVGIGLAFAQGVGNWNLRAALAGAVSTGGPLGQSGQVDPDLFLKVELRDSLGNRQGARPRTSTLDNLPIPRVLLPVGLPALTFPVASGNTAGQAFTLEFNDTLVDFFGQNGLYRAELEDEGGRRWVIWRPDEVGALTSTVQMHVPDLAAAGGVGLNDGTIRTGLSVFGMPGIDPLGFLWSDIPREHDLFAESAPVAFEKP